MTHLDRKEKTFGEILAAVKTRIARKNLPKLTNDGLVQYGLVIPSNYEVEYAKKKAGARGYDRHIDEPDIDWILQV